MVVGDIATRVPVDNPDDFGVRFAMRHGRRDRLRIPGGIADLRQPGRSGRRIPGVVENRHELFGGRVHPGQLQRFGMTECRDHRAGQILARLVDHVRIRPTQGDRHQIVALRQAHPARLTADEEP